MKICFTLRTLIKSCFDVPMTQMFIIINVVSTGILLGGDFSLWVSLTNFIIWLLLLHPFILRLFHFFYIRNFFINERNSKHLWKHLFYNAVLVFLQIILIKWEQNHGSQAIISTEQNYNYGELSLVNYTSWIIQML